MRITATSHLVTLNHFDPDLGILKRPQALDADPTVGVEGNSKVTDGFRPWKIDEVRAFYARHRLGSKANLAMTLLIITACRRSDLVRLSNHGACGQTRADGTNSPWAVA